MFENKKIAIVYDWFDKWGGVERVLLVLYEMFPWADFYTSYFDVKKADWAKNLKIKTSFIQRLPFFVKRNRIFSLPFYPFAFESFDFSRYNLVISVTSSFSKAVVTKPNIFHICYLLTPTRYLWVFEKEYFPNCFLKMIVSPYLNYLKKWDYVCSQRPDKIISISKTVADRSLKYYQRESEVIYPPFDVKYWAKKKSKIQNLKLETNPKFKIINSKQKYFLLVSRLEPYKCVDLVVRTFNKLDVSLVIVGEGTEEKKLKKIAGTNIFFFKKLTDEELSFLYSHAQALIMPQEEDFGYVALESQFFGCPVIAYKKGGATETILDGKTGIFFEKQTEKSLLQVLERFEAISYNLKIKSKYWGLKNIEKFEKNKFIKKFIRAINNS